MKDLVKIKDLADKCYKAYELLMEVKGNEEQKAATANYLMKVYYAKESANAQANFEQVISEIYTAESESETFADIDTVVLKPRVTTSRHITMVERFQMEKANGIICTPIIEDLEYSEA